MFKMMKFAASLIVVFSLTSVAYAAPPKLVEGSLTVKIKDRTKTVYIVSCPDGTYASNAEGAFYRLIQGKNEWYRVGGKDGANIIYNRLRKNKRVAQVWRDDDGKFHAFGNGWKGKWQNAAGPIPANVRSKACK